MGIVGDIAKGVFGWKASNKAADAQLTASRESNQALMDMYQQNRADLAPWRDAGRNALGYLAALSGMGSGGNGVDQSTNQLQALMQSPGYQFRLAQGLQALDRSAAARGGLYSGATLKALSRYNQDYAANEYGAQWNRLANLAGIGQQATNQTGSYGRDTAFGVASNAQRAGDARSSNYLNRADIIGSGIDSANNNAMALLKLTPWGKKWISD